MFLAFVILNEISCDAFSTVIQKFVTKQIKKVKNITSVKLTNLFWQFIFHLKVNLLKYILNQI